MFGMDFICNQIPNVLEPFDFSTFYSSKQQFAKKRDTAKVRLSSVGLPKASILNITVWWMC
jgi:hypothetical protein